MTNYIKVYEEIFGEYDTKRSFSEEDLTINDTYIYDDEMLEDELTNLYNI